MGFSTGFLKGATFTTAVLFVTLQLHTATRQHQHNLIREQIDSINALALRTESSDDFPNRNAVTDVLARKGYSTRERPAMMELWKERWNQDVQSFVRGAQDLEWRHVRGRFDDAWETLKRHTKGE